MGNTLSVSATMENCRSKNGLAREVSFPIEDQSFEFEIGCLKPGSTNSTADRLFFNGQLWPRPFPQQPRNRVSAHSPSTIRTSSDGSKCSWGSSRSNSSSSSSTRTNAGQASERRSPSQNQNRGKKAARIGRENRPIWNQRYGSPKRWQLIRAAPVLKRQECRQKSGHGITGMEVAKKQAKVKSRAGIWLGGKFMRSFVSTCKQCHAMKPRARDGGVLQET